MKNAVSSVVPLGTLRRLWVPSADQKTETKYTSVSFLLNILGKVILRCHPDRITGRIKEGPQLISGDNLLKAGRILFDLCRQKEKIFEYDTLSLFWLIDTV
jgi:hypothetical protein